MQDKNEKISDKKIVNDPNNNQGKKNGSQQIVKSEPFFVFAIY